MYQIDSEVTRIETIMAYIVTEMTQRYTEVTLRPSSNVQSLFRQHFGCLIRQTSSDFFITLENKTIGYLGTPIEYYSVISV